MPSILYVPPQEHALETSLSRTRFGARIFEAPPTSGTYIDPNDVYLIYFGYRTISGQIRKVKWHFLRRRGSAHQDSIAKDLIAHARADNFEYKDGEELLGLEWKGSCFIYIVLDMADCNFIDDQTDENYDPIFFHEKKTVAGTKTVLYFDENRSFYKGTILANLVQGVQVFRCINYFREEKNRLIRHPQLRTYGFDIVYNEGATPTRVDPDGQNQGPPSIGP